MRIRNLIGHDKKNLINLSVFSGLIALLAFTNSAHATGCVFPQSSYIYFTNNSSQSLIYLGYTVDRGYNKISFREKLATNCAGGSKCIPPYVTLKTQACAKSGFARYPGTAGQIVFQVSGATKIVSLNYQTYVDDTNTLITQASFGGNPCTVDPPTINSNYVYHCSYGDGT